MKLGAFRNQCGRCRNYFNSNTAFELHRTGKHGVDRRCMTPEEMTKKGMAVNADGFWVSELFTKLPFKKEEHESSP